MPGTRCTPKAVLLGQRNNHPYPEHEAVFVRLPNHHRRYERRQNVLGSMNETAHGKELPKPLQPRRRFHRFSAVELLVALGLLFFFFPFVEEAKGGDVIISILLSLV